MAQALKDRIGPRADHDTDLYSWVEEQVALLRAGRLSEIDAVHIAEELRDVGSEQYDRLESALAVLTMHMLKWDRQPERRSRSWANTIAEQHRRVERVLRRNPGLKGRLPEAIAEGYLDGRGRASTEMDVDVADLPASCPYSWDEMLTRPFDHRSPPQRLS